MVDFKKHSAKDGKGGNKEPKGSEQPAIEGQTVVETIGETASLDAKVVDSGTPPESTASPAQSTTNGSGPTVDTGTGEMGGMDNDVSVDVVEMPRKIVAKEIVPRAKLKRKRKWVPTVDSAGNPKEDADGNPVGVYETDPPEDIYTVMGMASGTESGTTSYGDWLGFTGTFEAIRTEDRKRYQSNRLILQEPAQSLLLKALQDLKERDPSGSVLFAFDIGIRTSQRWLDTTEGNSYEFSVRSVINVKRHDPLADLRSRVLPHLPPSKPAQLAAPVADKPA